MDPHTEQHDRFVKLVFEPSARLDGNIDTALEPGELRIVFAGRVPGRGRTFVMALQDATVWAHELAGAA
jgi:hypothetical protein